MPLDFIVGVGASAGGVEAIIEMVSAIPDDTGLSFVIVQHLAPDHPSLMDRVLRGRTSLDVRTTRDGSSPEANVVYVMPSGPGLRIENGLFRLVPREKSAARRQPINDFFVSVADEYGDRAACVVLSGSGSDGSAGLRAVKAAGGITVVQVGSSAQFRGMPESALATGRIDLVLRPAEIPGALASFFARRRELLAERSDGGLELEIAEALPRILEILKESAGQDFSSYKPGTLVRRIARRLMLTHLETVDELVERLEDDEAECDRLLQDFCIGVTRFFRDGGAFEALREQVIVPLVAGAERKIRVWVPGCSTGEEAYSIAMLILDEIGGRSERPEVQVFGTDIDLAALEEARRGVFPLGDFSDGFEMLRTKYFSTSDGHMVISSALREHVIFSAHDVLTDPPFSRIDLISCRNVLIYLNEHGRRTVIPRLHYALASGGYLFLGPSETMSREEDFFEPLSIEHRIFVRNDESVGTHWRANEELAASREELQSINEELETINGELRETNGQLVRALSDLRNVSDRLQTALDAGELGVVDIVPETGVVHWDDRVRAIAGVPPGAETTFETGLELVHEDDRDGLRNAIERTAEPGHQGPLEATVRIRRASDGLERWVHLLGAASRRGQENVRLSLVVRDVTQEVNAKSREEEYTNVLELAYGGAGIAAYRWHRDSDVSTWTPNMFELLGCPRDRQPSFDLFRSFIHPDDREKIDAAVEATLESAEEMNLRFRIVRSDGEERTLQGRSRVTLDADGRPDGLIGLNYDVTEEVRTEEHRQLLMSELSHRVKNSLAVIQTLAYETIASVASLEEFEEKFTGRLRAMASAHELLVIGTSEPATLEQLVRRQCEPYADLGSTRFSVKGPRIVLGPTVAQGLGMVLHELMTNAIKHGSLSEDEGRVEVSWETADLGGEAGLELSWKETGGPSIVAPERSGFGLGMIEETLSHAVEGQSRIAFEPDGLRATVTTRSWTKREQSL